MGEKRRVSLDINQRLKRFNAWFDEFILVAAKPLAMLGFAMGTVDIFVRGTLATQYWFALAWAIVQALTIDGLFFTVWWRIFAYKWKKDRSVILAGVGLVFIGCILELVAMATNGILTMQQLWNLPDSQQAMIRLGVNPFNFSVLRAILVVTTATMVAFVYDHSDSTVTRPATNVTEEVTESDRKVAELPAQEPLQLPAATFGSNVRETAKDRVREAMHEITLQGRPINLVEVASRTGLAYGTVKKHAVKARKELGI